MPDAAHNPARLLAPLALVVCAIAFFAILVGSDSSDDGGSDDSPAAAPTGPAETAPAERSRPLRRTYVVQPNDSLDGIAQRFGLEVEQLQELNPEVDPQGLVVGQRITLRE
jgi:LysM repeat protein